MLLSMMWHPVKRTGGTIAISQLNINKFKNNFRVGEIIRKKKHVVTWLKNQYGRYHIADLVPLTLGPLS